MVGQLLQSLLPLKPFAVTAIVCFSGLSSLFAQAPDLSVKLVAYQVILNGNKEALVAADKVKPGDVIEYQAVYSNAGSAAAQSVAATVPIPSGLGFLTDSARPAAEQASLDGKTFSSFPLTRKARTANGIMEEKPVAPSEYRALRWQIKQLAPGSSVTVALRAHVLTNEPKQ
jgi:uncharacterized repeat protein (TIGR01451 family)